MQWPSQVLDRFHFNAVPGGFRLRILINSFQKYALIVFPSLDELLNLEVSVPIQASSYDGEH